MGTTFRTACCRRWGIAEEAFDQCLFSRSLYRHAWPVAAVVQWLVPSVFADDWSFVERVATAQTQAEVREDIRYFEATNHLQPHWLRTTLRIRINARRVKALARQLLPPGTRRGAPPARTEAGRACGTSLAARPAA